MLDYFHSALNGSGQSARRFHCDKTLASADAIFGDQRGIIEKLMVSVVIVTYLTSSSGLEQQLGS
jgi:hypothetical protein